MVRVCIVTQTFHTDEVVQCFHAFLADRAAAKSMIGYWHAVVVCLSVCLQRCVLWRSGSV